MSYDFFSTSAFDKGVKRLSKKYPSLPKDLSDLKQELLRNPITGVSIGKNCYKIRMQISSKGKGKSGGARLITCVFLVEREIYLLDIFDKSDKENISDSELQELLKQTR